MSKQANDDELQISSQKGKRLSKNGRLLIYCRIEY